MDALRRAVEEAIADRRDEWPGHVAALDVRTWAETLERVRAELQAAVDRARAAGATWQDIGDVLGTTRASAQQRFGRRR